MTASIGQICQYRVAKSDSFDILNNGLREGDVLPAIIVRVWPDHPDDRSPSGVDIQIFADTIAGVVYKRAVVEGDEPGQYSSLGSGIQSAEEYDEANKPPSQPTGTKGSAAINAGAEDTEYSKKGVVGDVPGPPANQRILPDGSPLDTDAETDEKREAAKAELAQLAASGQQSDLADQELANPFSPEPGDTASSAQPEGADKQEGGINSGGAQE